VGRETEKKIFTKKGFVIWRGGRRGKIPGNSCKDKDRGRPTCIISESADGRGNYKRIRMPLPRGGAQLLILLGDPGFLEPETKV